MGARIAGYPGCVAVEVWQEPEESLERVLERLLLSLAERVRVGGGNAAVSTEITLEPWGRDRPRLRAVATAARLEGVEPPNGSCGSSWARLLARVPAWPG